MAGLGERDEISGQITTGHEWNGIKELNTPVPRTLYAFLILATLFAVTWTVLMPSWPGINGYFRGLLGVDQRTAVTQSVAAARIERAEWTARIETEDLSAIQADPALMTIVREAGAALFGDNCAACHGTSAQGNIGFPNLVAAPMMWGDDPDTVAETIRVGINGVSPETRYAQMLAFGRDQMLARAEIDLVVDYVRSLSDPTLAFDPEGETLFADNCASCHGDDGRGMIETGAPDLTDGHWIYGGDRASIRHSVYYGRAGHMPSWENRLSAADIRLLALYVLDLRAGRP